MAWDSQSSMKSMSHNLTKIDVVKFDSTNNFGMWKYDMMDALTTSNFEDSLRLEEKPEETTEKDWDKMNHQVLFVTQDIKYHVLYETSTRKIREILKKKYLTKSIKTRLHLKKRLYRFQLKRRLSIDDHTNNYTKLLADLVNMDLAIKEEDKALIFLNSLPDEEYETFVLTLINDKQTLNYSDVSGALVNYECRGRTSSLLQRVIQKKHWQ